MQQNPSSSPATLRSAQKGLHGSTEVSEGISTISLRDMFAARPEAAETFLQAYYEQFSKAFPNASERPLQERLQAKLLDPSSQLQIVCVVIGDQIVGGRHFKAFESSPIPFAAGEFLWVAENCRNLKLGTSIITLTEEIVRQKGIPFFIGEFHDPRLCSEKDREFDLQAGITPEQRLTFWSRRGYSQFDAPYICPPVFGSSDWTTNLTLGVKNLLAAETMTHVSTARYLSILHTYWNSFATNYETSTLYSEFMAQFIGVEDVQIVPLETPRNFKQSAC